MGSITNKYESWGKMYSKPASIFSFWAGNLLHLYFHFRIMKEIRKINKKGNINILEAGCGPGIQSIFLSWFYKSCRFILLDNDKIVLSNAKKNIDKYGHNETCISVEEADLFYMPFKENYFDLIISQGVWEHFKREDLKMIIREHLRVGKCIVISVPSDKYISIDYGNEILRTPSEYIDILREVLETTDYFEVKYYPFDIGIRTRFILFIREVKKRHNVLTVLKKTLLEPMHILIVVNHKL